MREGCLVAQITEYLNTETLQQLQDAFTAVAQTPIRIYGPHGELITSGSSPAAPEVDLATPAGPITRTSEENPAMPILVDDEVVGRVMLELPKKDGRSGLVYPRHLRLLGLVSGVIARLCQREGQLRTRVDELATLYHLTAEFSEQRDIQVLLDLITRTVVEAMGVKACSIRLISDDGRELVMRSVKNLSPEYLEKGPILLSQSRIDQEVLSTGQPLQIENMQTDPRVLYPEESRREGLVSGLCAPMMYKGRPEGVIRVYTDEPHTFDWFEESLLKAIAAEASAAIVNARLYNEAVRAASMQRQLRMAGVVQRRMIPQGTPDFPGFDIASIYVPCFDLAGDFFDFLHLGEKDLGIAVCDVVGKGVRASLLMASIRASLRAHAANIYNMSEVMQRVNGDLCADTLYSDFATLFYGVLNGPKKRFTYANAGHNPPILFRDGKAITMGNGGSVLGIDISFSWKQEIIDLVSGDVILIYTDGLNEAMNFEDTAFGRERTEKAVLAAISDGRDAQGIAKHVLWELRRFAGLQTQSDDLTLIAVKVL